MTPPEAKLAERIIPNNLIDSNITSFKPTHTPITYLRTNPALLYVIPLEAVPDLLLST